MNTNFVTLLGNGEKFSSKNYLEIFSYFLNNSPVVAVDGGANYCMEKNIIPEKIIGDFDSITAETEKFFVQKNIVLQKISEQDSTDLEKAIRNSDAEHFFCFGCTGDFFDHEISLLHILQKNSQKNIFIFTEHQVFFVLPKTGEISLQNVGAVPCVCPRNKKGTHKGLPLQRLQNTKISFYPLTPTTFVQSSGIKYPLDDLTLEQGKKIGTSNAIKPNAEKISWKISEGCCLGFFPIEFSLEILKNLFTLTIGKK